MRLEPPRSLYVHVPFCSSKCAYCDFFSLPRGLLTPALMEGVVEASLARIAELGSRFRAGGELERFDTLYVGGGTPSALPSGLLGRLLKGLAPYAEGAGEWTVEANPESLDEEALGLMLESGVTRLSLGAQSLDDALLERLGRGARAADVERALKAAARLGLPRRSADLIAGLPRRTKLSEEAEALVELGVEHLSVYDLILEEGTPLAARVASGDFVLPGEDEAYEEREALEAALARRGFRRYEVSNYSLPGAESRHNLAYWRLDSYLGAGPGAVSTLVSAAAKGSLRIEESRDLAAYAGGRAAGLAVETLVSPRDAAFESIMMGFRTIFGLSRPDFERRHGAPLESFIGATLGRWKERLIPGLFPDSLALDGRGLDLENRFLRECLEEMEGERPKAPRDR
jgi:oxygen-independent coproporphyrinogen-3 oxidase